MLCVVYRISDYLDNSSMVYTMNPLSFILVSLIYQEKVVIVMGIMETVIMRMKKVKRKALKKKVMRKRTTRMRKRMRKQA